MRLLVGVLLSVCLILGACNGGSDDGDSNITSEGLSQGITYVDRTERYILTVNYPTDWFATDQADLGIGITNSEALMQALLSGQRPTPEEDVISGNILFADFSSLRNINVTADTPLPVALSAYALGAFDVGINADSIEEVSINGTTVATTVVNADSSSVQFVMKALDGGIVIGYFGTLEGDMNQFRNNVLAIAAFAQVEILGED